MQLTNLLLVGLLLGMRHALEPDHIASVATISSEAHSIREGMMHGAVWGIGHTLTLFLFGGAVLLLGGLVPEQLAGLLELAVGIMLVALGADAVRRVVRGKIHVHGHRHGDGHGHIHLHSHQHSDGHQHTHPGSFPLRALGVGLMHGLAGSAALVLLAVASAPSVKSGLLYILVFGIGSIVGMGVITAGIALPLRLSSKRFATLHRQIRAGLGVVTILIGLTIVRSISIAIF